MGRLFSLLLIFALVPVQTHAQPDDCAKTETACVLDAAWSAALLLPPEKQDRLGPAFLEIAQMSDEPGLLSYWQSRFKRGSPAPTTYPDYGWEKAKPILESRGVDGLIDAATRREAALSAGRADALLAAGKQLARYDPQGARKVNQAILSLLPNASKFERPMLAHAAAELAMSRCDLDLLNDAVERSDAPRSLRYAFWSVRITREWAGLLSRVRALENDNDTRDVRRVLEGYRAILELGYCEPTRSAIGG